MFTIGHSFRAYTTDLLAEKLWRLHFACSNCTKGGAWSGAEMVEKFGSGVPIGQILERLKCGDCGGRDGAASLMQDHAAAVDRDVARYEAKNQ